MLSPSVFRDFPARAYLDKYYDYVGVENAAMMEAIASFSAAFRPSLTNVVEVGAGPSVLPVLTLCAAARRAPERIVFTDIAAQNLSEIGAWFADAEDAFDYQAVLAWLAREHRLSPSEIERLTRSAHWESVQLDLREDVPSELRGRFDTVSSHFFAESAARSRQEFLRLLTAVRQFARPDACLFLSFMRRSLGYTVAGKAFPAILVDESSLPELLAEAGLKLERFEIRVTSVEEPPTRPGYEGMVFVGGKLCG